MSENRTEQPTPRRLQNARKEGNFAPAGMAIPAVQLAAYMLLFSFGAPIAATAMAKMLRVLVKTAFNPNAFSDASRFFVPVLTAQARLFLFPALLLTAFSLILQLTLTQFGFSGDRLLPQWKRLNPMPRLAQMPKNAISSTVESILLLSAAFYLAYGFYRDLWSSQFLEGDRTFIAASMAGWQMIDGMLSKAAWLALLYGFGNFLRQRYEWANSMKMTKEEVKREHKESEGSPQIKSRIRRLQRDFMRRRMMSDVAKASAVIVNPTHYAVALRYEIGSTAAPRVVGKGKNYMAQRIRLQAIQNQIPIVENPPLAQALYQAADIGQEIPPHLYRAVAEVLAYIYRIMNERIPA